MPGPQFSSAAWPVVGLLAMGFVAAALSSEPSAIDAPRPPDHVIDTVWLLGADDMAVFERLAAGVKAAAQGDLVVVVVRTTEGRPPFALERASVIRGEDGRISRVRYVLPRHKAANWVGSGRGRKSTRPNANGAVELSPCDFLDRLADLVPPPRKHRHRPPI